MNDITKTATIQSTSYLNLGNMFKYSQSMMNNSFISSDGNYLTNLKAYDFVMPSEASRAVNLFYVAGKEEMYIYDWLKVDTTSIDLTITSLDSTLLDDLRSQLDTSDVRLYSMQLNKYEFMLLTYIDCDYISDINLSLNWDDTNQFVNDYRITKIKLNDQSIAFKLYHRFRW